MKCRSPSFSEPHMFTKLAFSKVISTVTVDP